jgi:hypothetical protein
MPEERDFLGAIGLDLQRIDIPRLLSGVTRNGGREIREIFWLSPFILVALV